MNEQQEAWGNYLKLVRAELEEKYPNGKWREVEVTRITTLKDLDWLDENFSQLKGDVVIEGRAFDAIRRAAAEGISTDASTETDDDE